MTDRFVRKSDLVAADMDGETVMMSVENGRYYGISGVGSVIWTALAEPTDIRTLIQDVCAQYDIAEDICRQDVERFVSDLLEHGLITSA